MNKKFNEFMDNFIHDFYDRGGSHFDVYKSSTDYKSKYYNDEYPISIDIYTHEGVYCITHILTEKCCISLFDIYQNISCGLILE